MILRRCLTAALAVLAMAALSPAKASAQAFYHSYLAATATSAKEKCSYYVSDIQSGDTRYVYLSFTNNTTGAYFHTANPAGSQITSAQISSDSFSYSGMMYSGKQLVQFEYSVCADIQAGCGYSVHFVARDKKSGKILMERFDKLDAGSNIYFCP